MNKLRWYAKSLRVVERGRRQWVARLGNGAGVAYYPRVVAAYLRLLTTGRKSMRYLGRPFAYDSPTTPVNLHLYQGEVGYQILQHVTDRTSIKRVLDIGANLGQFTVTLKHFAPDAQIDVFEPNSAIRPYLERNVAGLNGVRIFPYAIAPPSSSQSMFYEPNRSGYGSLIPENAGGGVWEGAVEVQIETISDVPSVTGTRDYDLVKVDVEGFEANVLRCLDGVRMRYLYLELSTRSRSKDYRHSDIFEILRRQFGEFDILCQEPFAGLDTYFNVLVGFYETQSPDASLAERDRGALLAATQADEAR